MEFQAVKHLSEGCIVEFMQDSIPQIAWILEEQKGKVRLILPNRRETSFNSNRLLPWYGPVYSGTKSREEIVQLLTFHKDKRTALAEKIDAKEVWEMSQGEVTQEKVEFFAELILNDLDADDIASFAHMLLRNKAHFRFSPPEFEVFDAETVQQKQEAEIIAQQRESMVSGGAQWFKALWDSYLKKQRVLASPPEEPVYTRLKQLLMRRIADPETNEDEHLWKQVSKILPDDPFVPLLLAMSWGILPEHHNYWLDKADYSAGTEWEKEYEEDAQSFIKSAEKLLHSTTYPQSSQTFITIDDASTKDIDDAFSIQTRPEGGWRVSVCIACPAAQWPFKSPLDKAIFQRASSIYLPEGTYHMMPELLGTDAFSLLQGKDRLTIIYHCEVDADGSLVHCEMETATVSVMHNLVYEACEYILNEHAGISNDSTSKITSSSNTNSDDNFSENDFLRGDFSDDETLNNSISNSKTHKDISNTLTNIEDPQDLINAQEHKEMIILAHELAQCRLAYRIRQGAIVIVKEEPIFYLDTDITHMSMQDDKIANEIPSQIPTATTNDATDKATNDSINETTNDTPNESADVKVLLKESSSVKQAQLLVSELMILANASLAEFAVSHSIPLLFRTQDIAIPKEYAGIWKSPQDIARVVRTLGAARIEIVAKPHAGMALKAYSPATSPLRRYADLVNEAQILNFLHQEKPYWDASELADLLTRFQFYADAVGQIQRSRPRYWKLLYFKQQAKIMGDKCGFCGIVSEENDHFVSVTMPKEQMVVRGKRQVFGGKVMLGQELKLRLGKIDPLRGEISILNVEEV